MTEQALLPPNASEAPLPSKAQVDPTQIDEQLHNQNRFVNLDNSPLCAPEEIGLQSVFDNGEESKIMGIVDLGGREGPKAAALVKITDPQTGGVRVAIGGLDRANNGSFVLNNNWIPFSFDHDPIVIGRQGDVESDAQGVIGADKLWPGTNFGERVSRKHLVIVKKGNVVEFVDQSLNGTKVKFGPEEIVKELENPDDFGHMAKHTLLASDLARLRGQIRNVEGKPEEFADRQIISRKTTDPEGKVDIRSWAAGGEAIVIDSKKDPEPYEALLSSCMDKLAGRPFGEEDLVKAVFDTVSEAMDYDLAFAETPPNGLDSNHRKVNLAYYLGARKGVCRHMALACQWLGARMKDTYPQLIGDGVFTTPVNQRTQDNAAHEWARYTSQNGRVYIMDVAQNFVGTLEDALADSKRGKQRWEYFTDAAEKRLYEEKALGELASKSMLPNKFQRFFKKPRD